MPKLKTKSGAKKRFKITATGKIKAGVAGKRHRLLSHNAKYIRQNRGTKVMSDADAKIIKSFLPYGLFPSLERDTLIGGSLYRTLAEKHNVRLRRAEQRIRAAAATAEQARLLGVPRRSPLLSIERTTTDERNIRIEYARSWARPDFELTVHLER